MLPSPADILADLNAPQRAAVTHPFSPLIVLAGPGTGKTRVITHRIAHLLLEHKVEPESIVAVTFTIKAAQQLRERLHTLVGPALGDRVNASTFHALGMRIIQRFGDTLIPPKLPEHLPLDKAPVPLSSRTGTFGVSLSRAGLIDSTQRKRILRFIIEQLRLFPDRRGLGLEDSIALLSSSIAALSEQAIFPEDCARFLPTWADALNSGRSIISEKLDAQAIAAQREQLHTFGDVTKGYQAFDALLRRLGLLTYSDLITLPIRLFRQKNSPAAAILRSDWRHFVVDEFQDVNAGQIELLRQLAPPSNKPDLPGPDVCVVGDDDQSIYAFRGADERAFARFASIWNADCSPVPTIRLEDNYRSAKPIVAAANAVIAAAQSRFDPGKIIRSSHPTDPSAVPDPPILGVLTTTEHHFAAPIAALIRTFSAALPTPTPDAASPSPTFAVISRTHLDGSRIAASLELEGLRVRVPRRESIADDPGVADLLAYLRLLADPCSRPNARRLLARPPRLVPPEQLATLERAFDAASTDNNRHNLADAPPPTSYFDFASCCPIIEPATRSAAASLKSVFDQLRPLASNLPACTLMRQIIAKANLAASELLPARQRAARIRALVAALRFADQLQPRLDPPGDLHAFLNYYDDLDSEEQSMNALGGIDDRIDADPDDAADIVDSQSTPGQPTHTAPIVEIINVHKAKGLEFDFVFVPRVSPPHGYPLRTRSSSSNSAIPPGLLEFVHPLSHTSLHADSDAHLEEERRIFYVAATRARQRLVLLSKATKSRSKSTHFFQELSAAANLGSPGDAAHIPFELVHERDVLAQAARAGLLSSKSITSDFSDSAAIQLHSELGDTNLFDRARTEACLAAAGALERLRQPDLLPADLCAATANLAYAAAACAVISAIEHAPDLEAFDPKSLLVAARLDTPQAAQLSQFIEHLRASARQLRLADAPTAELRFASLPPPLTLSYSSISAYLRCPRCFYLHSVLGLQEHERAEEVVGQVVHAAIEQFLLAQRAAENDDSSLLFNSSPSSSATPTLETLLTLGEREFLTLWPANQPIDHEQAARIRFLLETYFQRFHKPDDHVLEIERRVSFPYAALGHTHRLSAKIDRIDQATLPSGASCLRIVDYKTGKPWNSLLEPSPDDLQLGIYALALAHLFPASTQSDTPDTSAAIPPGVAQYWLLSTAQRSSIDLASLRIDKVRGKIDKAIAGMLAGNFTRASDCDGPCTLFEHTL